MLLALRPPVLRLQGKILQRVGLRELDHGQPLPRVRAQGRDGVRGGGVGGGGDNRHSDVLPVPADGVRVRGVPEQGPEQDVPGEEKGDGEGDEGEAEEFERFQSLN